MATPCLRSLRTETTVRRVHVVVEMHTLVTVKHAGGEDISVSTIQMSNVLDRALEKFSATTRAVLGMKVAWKTGRKKGKLLLL